MRQLRDMKVLIAGSRGFLNYNLLEAQVDQIANNITEIVSGTARGADHLGETYAREHKISIKKMPAEWDRLGKQAGFARNKQMSQVADMGIIFWDGRSRGTANMIEEMRNHGKPTIVIRYAE